MKLIKPCCAGCMHFWQALFAATCLWRHCSLSLITQASSLYDTLHKYLPADMLSGSATRCMHFGPASVAALQLVPGTATSSV